MGDSRHSVRPAPINRVFRDVRHALAEGESSRLDHSWRELDAELNALLRAEEAMLLKLGRTRHFDRRSTRGNDDQNVEPTSNRARYRTGT